MLMPDPDQAVIGRRDEICTGLRKILPATSLVDSPESMKAFDSDGLSAYRQSLWLLRFRKRSTRSRQ